MVAKKEIAISVIIPVYNKAPHVKRSIDSVLKQSFQNYELILINDASTDESLEKINKYKDSRIKIFHREVPGPGGYAARNLGIRKAKGEWISFLDADDEWLPQHLEKTVETIEEFDSLDFISSGWEISKAGKRMKDLYYVKNVTKGKHKIELDEFTSGERPMWTSVVTVRKALLMKVGGFDESWKHGADVDLWLKLILYGENKGLWLPHIGAIYHMDSVNMVTSKLHQIKSPVIDTIKKFFIEQPDIPAEKRQKLKTFSNIRANTISKRKLWKGELTFTFLFHTYYFEVLSFVEKILLISVCSLPSSIQKRIAKIFLSD